MNLKLLSKIWLIITQVLMALSVPVWAMGVLMSLMAFDGGIHASAIATVGVILAYPLLPLGCAIMSWTAWKKDKHRAAMIWTTLPFVVVGAVALYIQNNW